MSRPAEDLSIYNITYGNISSTTPPLDERTGWDRAPDPEKLNHLVELIQACTVPITARNFRRWLVDTVAYEMDGIACPNGKDHGCNRGLGTYLGIEPYGQTDTMDDGDGKFAQKPWDQQKGFSAERFNRHALPAWRDWIVTLPFEVQKVVYTRLLIGVRDTGRFDYNCMYPTLSEMEIYNRPPHMIGSAVYPVAHREGAAITADPQQLYDNRTYGSDIAELPTS